MYYMSHVNGKVFSNIFNVLVYCNLYIAWGFVSHRVLLLNFPNSLLTLDKHPMVDSLLKRMLEAPILALLFMPRTSQEIWPIWKQ
jgi:hypothetical protein